MIEDQGQRENDEGKKDEYEPRGTVTRLKPLTKCFHRYRIKGLFLFAEYDFLIEEEIEYSGDAKRRYVTP